MLRRIEARLRRVLIKACENSGPASLVVEQVEAFLRQPATMHQWSPGLFVEDPTVTTTRTTQQVFRFVFDASPNAGFHRLLVHGLCQFHGFKAVSSTSRRSEEKGTRRILVATGSIANDDKIHMVDYIMQRKEGDATTNLAPQ